MIYTLTLNPALDYLVRVPDYQSGKVNRMGESALMPGGKGINVSLMLRHLDVGSVALGFVAGFTGRELTRVLEEENCRTDFLELTRGNTRINVKLKTSEETEINAPGPEIPASALEALQEKISNLQKGDILVLAGSIPKGMPDTIYRDMAKVCRENGVDFVVDAEGELLLKTLPYQPFLIKPNHHELGAIFRMEITTAQQAVEYAKELQKQGARNVLISMGAAGAVLVAETAEVYQAEAPKGRLVNSTGAGDSMVAGFLAGYLQTENVKDAFYLGVAAGSATAFAEGLAQGDAVWQLYQNFK